MSKCKILKVTRSVNSDVFAYSINEIALETVNDMRDLGIVIDDTVSWNDHVRDTVSKANRIMGIPAWGKELIEI